MMNSEVTAPKYQCSPHEKKALSTYVKLVRAAESTSLRIHRYLQETGLTGSQFGVLEALYSLGPLCQKQIGDKILKTSGNITLVIDNLEKQGLVLRCRDQEDRRYVTVSLTDKGYQLFHEIFPKHAAAVAEDLKALTEEEQEELGRLCRKLGKQ